MANKVLIIDDDRSLCQRLRGILTRNLDCVCDTAGRIVFARNLLREYDYDMVILDRELPDGDGMELVRQQVGSTPVSQYFILSGWGAITDREKGLEGGVFEYLVKPFSKVELLAKAKLLLAAHGCLSDDYIKIDDNVVVLLNRGELVIDGQRKKLAPAEIELLSYLADSGVASCLQLRENVWPDHARMSNNAIAVRISRLRGKLGRYGDRIQSHYRVGYQLQLANNAMIDTKMI